jgi:hypothetical protein
LAVLRDPTIVEFQLVDSAIFMHDFNIGAKTVATKSVIVILFVFFEVELMESAT